MKTVKSYIVSYKPCGSDRPSIDSFHSTLEEAEIYVAQRVAANGEWDIDEVEIEL